MCILKAHQCKLMQTSMGYANVVVCGFNSAFVLVSIQISIT